MKPFDTLFRDAIVERTLGIFAGTTILLATGCASTPPNPAPPPRPARVAPAQAPAPTDNRVIVDTALDRTLRVLSVLSSTGPDGLLKIQVNVQNISDTPRWFSYRVEWFDEEGKPLPLAPDKSLSWMLLAHETSSIVAVAPAATAKDFGVAFLAPRNKNPQINRAGEV